MPLCQSVQEPGPVKVRTLPRLGSTLFQGGLLSMRLIPRRRWGTRFGSWVQEYTAARILEGLAQAGEPTARASVSHWVSGHCAPRPSKAVVLVRLAAGRLTLEDVYRHREEVISGDGSEHRKGPVAGGAAVRAGRD